MIYRFSIVLFLLVIACSNKPENNQFNSENMKPNTSTDTLIFDYTFGMTRDEFFDYSWRLNSQGIVSNGNGAEIAESIDWLKSPAKRIFYPTFIDDKIVRFPISYRYEGWAPWNEHLNPEELIKELLPILSDDYGVKFDTLKTKEGQRTYVGTFSNTEIVVFKETHSNALVVFTDLSKPLSGTN